MTGDLRRVIFDTDPGIDDAMALLFLHAAPEVELVGVTTCFGNGTLAATTRNARHIVERFAIPTVVIAGAAEPLEGSADLPPAHVHGGNALGDVPVPLGAGGAHDAIPAWRFMIDKIRQNPGEISIVAVGRMTNLALALRADPEIAALVRDVVIMGGAFGHHGHHGNVTPLAEANIHGDAQAADEVFAAAWPITVVGLDVTMQARMSEPFLASLRRDARDAGQFIWDITRIYAGFHQASTGSADIYVHDSSAVACLLRPSLFRTCEGAIRVVSGGLAHGQTALKPDGRGFPPSPWDGRPSHAICTDVDSEALRALYGDTLRRLA